MSRWFGVVGVVSVVVVVGCAQPDVPAGDDNTIVVEATAADVSPPLRDMTATSAAHASFPALRLPRPTQSEGAAPIVPQQPFAVAAPTTTVNFDGLGAGFANFTVQSAPPDPDGDVGPNHYVQIVNTSFAVFDKTGQLVYGPAATNTLWSGFGGGCEINNDGDASVRYDRLADRWVITQFSVSSTPYLQCVAVSTTPDPTGSYYRYSFSFGSTDFPDYPKLALWPDAYYITFNIFANLSAFSGGRVCALDRAKMLAGPSAANATMQCRSTSNTYGGLLVGDLDGPTQPPSGSPAYVLALGDSSFHLAFWKFHVDFANSANTTFTGPTALTVSSYTPMCGGVTNTCVPQPGTTQKLDGLDDRLMNRLVYRNYGDHEALFATHAVAVGTSGAMRWYEYRNLTGSAPTLYQSGTYAPDASWRWMGSIAADSAGNVALGFSVSDGSSVKPSIRVTGRLAGDSLGVMTVGETTLIAGTGVQTGSNLSRWGDYTSLNVDPSDDCTFWYVNQYLKTNGAFNWSTRIGAFKLPNCTSTDTTAPTTSITAPADGSTVNGSVTISADAADDVGVVAVDFYAGSALLGTGASSPYSFSWDTTLAADGDVVLTTIAHDAAGNSATSAAVTVHVLNHPDTTPPVASITSPAAGATVAGTQTVTIAASDDVGVTKVEVYVDGALLATPTSWVTTTVPDGWHTLLAKAYDASGNVGTSLPVSVFVRNTTAAVELVVNGGFELGSLSGWSASGSVQLTTSPVASGSFAATVGANTATTTDSVLSQSVQLPSTGTIRFRFSYQLACAKRDKHDRERAYVTNSGGTVLATVFDSCSQTRGWKSATTDLSAYAGQLVYLYFYTHDDGNVADPSWMYVDNVSVTDQ